VDDELAAAIPIPIPTPMENGGGHAFLFHFEQKDAKIAKAGLLVRCGISFAVFAAFCSNS